MESLAVFIGQFINWIILGLAIITVVGFSFVVLNVGKLQAEMDEDQKRKIKKDYTAGGIKKIIDPDTWAEVLEYLEKFNKIQLKYSIFEQFVPVFPLLGILGTVAGLIQKLGDVEGMKDALAVSMSTTFWGLIAAILLKVVDAALVSKVVNKMSLYFETYEQSYQMVRDRHMVENDSE